MKQAPDLSIVFPVYNEEENVPILLEEIVRALDGKGWTYEIVAVDDGSHHSSLQALRSSRSKHPSLRILALEKNTGQTAALDAGWRANSQSSSRRASACPGSSSRVR